MKNLEPLPIYNKNKPDIISFISDEDYRVLLNFYTARIYGSNTDLNTIMRPYPYDKYSWNELLHMIWLNQNFWKQKNELLNTKIKECEIVCMYGVECDYTSKKFLLSNVPEMPVACLKGKEAICQSRLTAIIKF